MSYQLNNQKEQGKNGFVNDSGMVWDICKVNKSHGRVTCTTQTKQPSVVMADHYLNNIISGRIIYLRSL
jgi:hypothetical protein